MSIPGSGDDGNMISNLSCLDLAREIVDSEQQKPWPSGIHATTLYKKLDFRVVLIFMETAARMKEHHVDGTSSVQVFKGHVRYSARWRFDQARGRITRRIRIPIDHLLAG